MTDTDIRQKIRGERLRLAANMCQTLAIGVVLVAVLPPLLGATGAYASLPWPNLLGAAIVIVLLLSYAHILIGAAVRAEAWTA
jgi:hypothetical protein